MIRGLFRLAAVMLAVVLTGWLGYSQGGTDSSLAGTIFDRTGAVVPGAGVTVKNNATNKEFEAVTADNGTFFIPLLEPGSYTATILMPGFKRAIVNGINLRVGLPGTIRVTLEVGGSTETTTVQANTDLLQTQVANAASTMTTKQITQLPGTTRNVMDLLIFLPGVNTTTINRNSTISGLPNNNVNITIDGINTQDNYLKGNAGGDGFNSIISPTLDAVEEVTMSTAATGPESASNGAIQIKYVTRSGGNGLHGSLYEYHRNPDFNANYWFNNRDKAPTYNGSTTPCTAQQLATEWGSCKAPRDRVLLNQPGGRVGGPILLPRKLFGPLGFNGRDRAFFFVNLEGYWLPAQQTRTRTIFSPLVEQGIFPYTVAGTTRTVDLMALAAANGQTSTIDPTIKNLLSDIRNSTSQGTLKADVNPALQEFIFTNKGLTEKRLLTTRFDFNLSSAHRLEVSYAYQKYKPSLDLLDNYDPAFPGFPNEGFQSSNRFIMSNTLRSTLKPTLLNELRFGFAGGTTLLSDVNAGQFKGTQVANQNGYALGLSSAMGINNPYSLTTASRRNAPVRTIQDTASWTTGDHSISFGFSLTRVSMFVWSQQQAPTISFGVDATDPAALMFNASNGPRNFPNASSIQYGNAQNTYAVLTGRVTQIGGSAVLGETTNNYTYNGANIQRGHMSEIGFFVQDSWRWRSNLTLTYGVRLEVQSPFAPDNGLYTANTVDDLWGLSGYRNFGSGNLYTPGTLIGSAPTWKQLTSGTNVYGTRYKNFAPSFGFAWMPYAPAILRKIAGEPGQSVIRAGASIAYNRNGMYDYSSVFASNPGITINATRNMSNGNLVTNTGTDVLPVLFRDTGRLGPPSFTQTPVYPLQSTSISDEVNLFDPNMRAPYTYSWTFGWQREIRKDLALEVRYVGIRNQQPWTVRNLNEQNIKENGFLDEFRLAMANLQANLKAQRGRNFKYYGKNTGTSPLPIILAYFSGIPSAQSGDPAKYSSPNFSNSTYYNTLAQFQADPYTFASNLWASSTQRQNALNAGLPENEFVVNPTVASGGAWMATNGGYSFYNAVVAELRGRLLNGLQVQADYTHAKEIDSSVPSFRSAYVNVTGTTLPHAFKVNFVYELPFGSGRTGTGAFGSVLDRVFGGWEFNGTGRWQSGNLLNFGNVQLVGMTLKDLQSAVGLRFDNANKVAYYLPADILSNTIKAFSTSATNTSGYSQGKPSGRYLAPASTTSCVQVVSGDCAPYTVYVRGPRFQRFDLSLVKKIRFTESKNLELRGEFLNAFNNTNFFGATCASGSPSCGQVTSAYTDSSNTQDPGGRLIQLVLRINF